MSEVTSKSQFIQKTELAQRLRDVVQSSWFRECLTYARAEMMGVANSVEELRGAMKFESVLLDLPVELPEPAPDESGLQHDIDAPGKKRGEQKKTKK